MREDFRRGEQNTREIRELMIRRIALLAALFLLVLSIASPQTYAYAFAEGEKAEAVEEKAEPLADTTELVGITAIGDPDAKAPSISADAAVIYSLDLDRVVYGDNEDKVLDPYSITKVLTCYLALENLDPEKVVTVSADATQEYVNGTSILLKEGEKIRVIDLIYGAMMESGNDAAYALGEAVAGSEKKFAALMNETVESWGCTNTHFVNANGWKNKDHYTTARELAIIARNCFAREDLLKNFFSKNKYFFL